MYFSFIYILIVFKTFLAHNVYIAMIHLTYYSLVNYLVKSLAGW